MAVVVVVVVAVAVVVVVVVAVAVAVVVAVAVAVVVVVVVSWNCPPAAQPPTCRRCSRYRCVRPQSSAQRRRERLLLRCRMRAPPRASCRKAEWSSCIRQARGSSARPRRRLLPGQPTPVTRRSGTARVPEQSRRVALQQ